MSILVGLLTALINAFFFLSSITNFESVIPVSYTHLTLPTILRV